MAAAGPVEEDAAGLAADIRGFVRARAPAHLHPARITVVPALARTASGKVDRRATHARYGQPPRQHRARSAEEPRT